MKKLGRMEFVDEWAEFVKSNPDRIWSEQQRILIDSQISNARKSHISKEQYLEIKKKK